MAFINQLLQIKIEDLFRIRKTCYEMIADRHFKVVSSEDYNEVTSNNFEKFKELVETFKTKYAIETQKNKTAIAKVKSIAKKKRATLRSEIRKEEKKQQTPKIVKKLKHMYQQMEYFTEECLNACLTLNPPFFKLLSIWCEHQVSHDKLLVIFLHAEKLGKNTLLVLKKFMTEQNITDLVIVSKEGYTNAIKVNLHAFSRKTIRCFDYSELLINITHHKFVPQHILLSEIEKKNTLEKLRIQPHHLPILRRDDAIAKYYNFRPNQVIKIMQISQTVGFMPKFRLVK